MSAIGPIPSASLTRRRSRKKSVKSRGDKLDGTSGSPESDGTPMLFGQIPVEPPALNFSRDRKHSTGAVNMDPKFSSPALQAAMKSSTSLVENSRSPEVTRTTRPFSSNWKRHAVHEEPDANHSPSTIAHAVESGTLNSVRNNHKTSSYLPVYLPGKKKSTPGIRKGPTQNNPSVPPTSAPSSSATPPELTPSSSLLSGNSRHSFGLGVGTRNAPSFPSPQPTSPATENVSQTLKHRFSFSRKTKRSMDLGSAAPPCTATQPSPSSLRERADNLAALSRTSRPPTGGESAKNTQSLPTTHSSSVRSPGFTANQDATQFSPFYAPTGTAKRAKKTSFSNLFTKNRNRSTAMEDNPDRQVTPMQKAMDSSVSLAESVTKRRSLVNFFRNRTKSTEGHTDALDKPGLGLHPDGGKNIDLSASRSLKSPQEPVKRRKSFQRLGAKPKPLTATESSGPSVAALFKPLSARAPEFIPRGLCTKLVPDTGPLVFASTSKEKAYPLGPTVVGSTDSVGKAAETNVVSTSTTDRLQTASQSNHQSSCTSPHRRKASSEAVRKPLRTESTVPFPVSHDEPVEIAVAVDAEVLVIASEDELKLTEDNRYWIYKSLLGVLWTEAKSRDDTGVQQEIRQCSRPGNTLGSSPIAELISALDSQRHLLQIAAALSLKRADVRISSALCEDRKNIKSRLISFQRTILDAPNDYSCLLDLVQEILDSAQENGDTIDTTLRRLIVKLSSSSGRLPSSLSIQGVEHKDQHPTAGGGFGDIYKAVYQTKTVALKFLKQYQDQTDDQMRKIRDKICQEALLWKDLRHPFILPFIGLYSCENGKNEGPLSVAMVCPWMQNGTIVKYLKDNQPAPVDQFLLEIAEGLHYLHSRGVIHGDLRGSNILVDDEGHARLADFGLASYANTTAESSARAGSTRWMAPELFSPDTFRRTWSTDVYAFACVCYELYHGKSPFSEIQADSAVLLAVIEGNRPRRLAAIPPSTWLVIQACWRQEPQERLVADQIIQRFRSIQAMKLKQIADRTTSRVDSQAVYKAPRSGSFYQTKNASSTLSLARPPSLVVNLATPHAALRRHASFDFCRQTSGVAQQQSWRDRTISLLFPKRKDDLYAAPSVAQTEKDTPGTAGKTKRPRILSFWK